MAAVTALLVPCCPVQLFYWFVLGTCFFNLNKIIISFFWQKIEFVDS